MDSNFTSKYNNQEFLSIYVKPYIDDEKELQRNLNLTWNITNFNVTKLEIQVTFGDPTAISIEEEFDKLMFEVENVSEIFRSSIGKKVNTTISSISCPK